MLLVFMIYMKELTNQILLPRPRIVADSVFLSEWRCVHAAFALFLADCGREEQDDRFLG